MVLVGIGLAIFSESRNNEVNEKINLIDRKVFGHLYSLSDTLIAMVNIITRMNTNNFGQAHKKDNLFLMAYWLWFGMDEEWHTRKDIQNVKFSKVYNSLKTRILNNNRISNSKTTIIVYDPTIHKEKIINFIQGLIKNKSKEISTSFKKDEIILLSEAIFESYTEALYAIKNECKNSHCNGDEIILCTGNIPNIIFAKEFDNENYGISFLGEIDFLDFNFKKIKDDFFKKNYSNSSEFFGFQTYDPNMIKSLIKQVYLIKFKCTS